MPYRRVGQPFRISTTVKDITGALADPTDINLVIRDPLLVETIYDYNPGPIIRDSLGAFHYDANPSSPFGDYAWSWQTTGTNAGVTEKLGRFTLVGRFTPLLLTMDEAKSQLQITGVADADLERYVDSAVVEVENAVGQPVVPKTVTRVATVLPGGRLLLPHNYVVSVTSATLNGVAASTTGWTVDGGIVTTPSTYLYGTWVVTYQPGFDPIPEPLRDAAALFTQHAMETQRGAAEQPLQDVVEGVGSTFALVLRARDKIAPYRVPAVA